MKRIYTTFARPGEVLDKLLGELEREIMEVFWVSGSGSVRDVLTQLNARRRDDEQLAYTTVMTVMARLTEKALLRRRLIGKAHQYEAAESREAFLARTSHNLARQLVEDFGDAAIAGFLNVLEGVAPERLAELRRRVRQRAQD